MLQNILPLELPSTCPCYKTCYCCRRFDVVVVTHASPEHAKTCLLAVDTNSILYPDDAAAQDEKLVCVPPSKDKNAVQALAGTVGTFQTGMLESLELENQTGGMLQTT